MKTLNEILIAFNKKGIEYEIIPWTIHSIKFKFKPSREELRHVTFPSDYNFCFRLDEEIEDQDLWELKHQLDKPDKK